MDMTLLSGTSIRILKLSDFGSEMLSPYAAPCRWHIRKYFSGGGTSGCVLANELAKGSKDRILVIEAGPSNANLELVHMPGGLFQAFWTDLDWSLWSTPQKALNNRKISLNRGKFLGGSSGFNGTICSRGTKQDYDDWGYVNSKKSFHQVNG